MTSLTNLSASQLRRAAGLKERIETLESELGRLLGSNAGGAAPASPGVGTRRPLSAAARRKIAAAQRRRWAKNHSTGGAGAPAKKRRMSAAARARIAEAARRRWAAVRAAKKGQ